MIARMISDLAVENARLRDRNAALEAAVADHANKFDVIAALIETQQSISHETINAWAAAAYAIESGAP